MCWLWKKKQTETEETETEESGEENMTVLDFVNEYLGKKVDYDGKYGPQCVDLYRQYCHDVLNIEHTGAVNGAKELFLNYSKLPKEQKYFDCFEKPMVTFKAGDVVVWNSTSSNQYGHVAIYLCDFGDEMVVFEQNGFTQDGAKLMLRSYSNCLGVLRRKVNG